MAKTPPTHRQPGFTLLEAVITITVMLVIGSILLPKLAPGIKKSRVARAQTELRSFHQALTRVQMDTGYFPRDLHRKGDVGLVARHVVPPHLQGLWDGPYLLRWPVEGHPWGGLYQYAVWDYAPFDFDGEPGNEVLIQILDGELTAEILDAIDTRLDDGMPTTGLILHNGSSWLRYYIGEGPSW